MMAGWAAVFIALAYLLALFAVAHYGDRSGRRLMESRARPLIYALTLGVYCTSWTFYGSVGLASRSGLDFLPIYIGPLIVVTLLSPLLLRIVSLAKSQNITSIADFVGSRYGKSEQIAAMVAIIAVIGVVPYIALQLKAVVSTMSMVLGSVEAGRAVTPPDVTGLFALAVAILLAMFAMAFGTRHIDATEHQDGLVLAVAMESLIKLAAFLIVGAFVTWYMFDGFADLSTRATRNPVIKSIVSKPADPAVWVTTTLLAACAIIMLPRQFHVAVVENRDQQDVKTAAWLFPLYLVAINIFVVPLAIAGLVTFSGGIIDRDFTVLALPLEAGNGFVTIIAMIGGLSAATAMVIVSCVALSIMVSNDLMMPLLLRGRTSFRSMASGNPAATIVRIRRIAIVALLALAFLYLRFSSEAALASIGLLSFAAIAQIAPAMIGGLFWSRATARGALAGLITGLAVWAYTLLLPSFESASSSIASLVDNGPLSITPLRPTALFGIELPTLVHGVMFSLAANILAFLGFSLTRNATPIERLQANIFIGRNQAPMGQSLRLWRANISAGELQAAVSRYLGEDHTRHAFDSFQQTRGLTFDPEQNADIHLIRFAEHILASGIGAASSRLVLSMLLRQQNISRDAALEIIDEASATFQQNRDVLQHALDHARQGITVFDRDLQLICWNREFTGLFSIPHGTLYVGMGLEELVAYNAERGIYGPGGADFHVGNRLELLVNETQPFRLRLHPSGRVIEIRSARMPDGGLVTTYTDVTQSVAAEEALEQRVRERTEQLEQLNTELARAKAEADDANISKTRFLAAASHDILQPLNAARLYATSLVERAAQDREVGGSGSGSSSLINNLDASLESVEEILTALLDISRLDAGALKPERSIFPVSEMFEQLQIEFGPMAREAGLRLTFVPSSLHVHSDRRLLRRLLQNLVSNAIKYTRTGRVLVGCRRKGPDLHLEVWDTGLGIPADKQKAVFDEFERLAPAARSARGLGLGLSIVQRIARVLDLRVDLHSQPGKGSVFAVAVPKAEPAVRQASGAAAARPSTQPLSGVTVVAIDNEPAILDGLRVLLGGWGCHVVTAPDAHQAIAALREAGIAPDGILADYHLDAGNGLDAIGSLRAALAADVPAVLITADRTDEVRDAAADHDVHILNKPLRPAALRALISQWRITRDAAE